MSRTSPEASATSSNTATPARSTTWAAPTNAPTSRSSSASSSSRAPRRSSSTTSPTASATTAPAPAPTPATASAQRRSRPSAGGRRSASPKASNAPSAGIRTTNGGGSPSARGPTASTTSASTDARSADSARLIDAPAVALAHQRDRRDALVAVEVGLHARRRPVAVDLDRLDVERGDVGVAELLLHRLLAAAGLVERVDDPPRQQLRAGPLAVLAPRGVGEVVE